jgi:hypothetical protein
LPPLFCYYSIIFSRYIIDYWLFSLTFSSRHFQLITFHAAAFIFIGWADISFSFAASADFHAID